MDLKGIDWERELIRLCDDIRTDTREVLLRGLGSGDSAMARPAAQGVGDVTYGLDLPSERRVETWARELGARSPLSVLSEGEGWRHWGPDPAGGCRSLETFDHGGPRIAIDPVDGTRNLMTDLRSAWTAVALCPPGAGAPTVNEVSTAVVSEIPTSRAGRYGRLVATGPDRVRWDEASLLGEDATSTPLCADGDDRVDHGYFPFFRYMPDQRPHVARLEASFFAHLAATQGADVRNCYDDQYICNAGQLVLLARGTYRMIVDARAWIGAELGVATITSKPYDVAAAIFCARAAGCEVTGADGSELDFPLDAVTPVHFAGYANAATRARLAPCLEQARKDWASQPPITGG